VWFGTFFLGLEGCGRGRDDHVGRGSVRRRVVRVTPVKIEPRVTSFGWLRFTTRHSESKAHFAAQYTNIFTAFAPKRIPPKLSTLLVIFYF